MLYRKKHALHRKPIRVTKHGNPDVEPSRGQTEMTALELEEMIEMDTLCFSESRGGAGNKDYQDRAMGIGEGSFLWN